MIAIFAVAFLGLRTQGEKPQTFFELLRCQFREANPYRTKTECAKGIVSGLAWRFCQRPST